MSSTEFDDAASISITSSEVAEAIETQESQTPHGSTVGPVHAVQAGGEDLRHRGLAGAARADEQVGVVDPVARDGVGQRAHDVLLADHLGEGPRAVAAVERGACGHGSPESTPTRGADSVPAMRLQARHSRSSSARSRCGWRSGVGFANYDTLYSLVWGQQLARGQTPSYRTPLAPTPHPLLEALGAILSPLGAAATVDGRRRARLPGARGARLPRLPARHRLVFMACRPGREPL